MPPTVQQYIGGLVADEPAAPFRVDGPSCVACCRPILVVPTPVTIPTCLVFTAWHVALSSSTHRWRPARLHYLPRDGDVLAGSPPWRSSPIGASDLLLASRVSAEHRRSLGPAVVVLSAWMRAKQWICGRGAVVGRSRCARAAAGAAIVADTSPRSPSAYRNGAAMTTWGGAMTRSPDRRCPAVPVGSPCDGDHERCRRQAGREGR